MLPNQLKSLASKATHRCTAKRERDMKIAYNSNTCAQLIPQRDDVLVHRAKYSVKTVRNLTMAQSGIFILLYFVILHPPFYYSENEYGVDFA
jgi:hypothetical protein